MSLVATHLQDSKNFALLHHWFISTMEDRIYKACAIFNKCALIRIRSIPLHFTDTKQERHGDICSRYLSPSIGYGTHAKSDLICVGQRDKCKGDVIG